MLDQSGMALSFFHFAPVVFYSSKNRRKLHIAPTDLPQQLVPLPILLLKWRLQSTHTKLIETSLSWLQTFVVLRYFFIVNFCYPHTWLDLFQLPLVLFETEDGKLFQDFPFCHLHMLLNPLIFGRTSLFPELSILPTGGKLLSLFSLSLIPLELLQANNLIRLGISRR